MDLHQMFPARGRVKIDGGGSATAIALATFSHWVLTNVNLAWTNMAQSTTISLYQIDSTNSSAFFVFMTSCTNDFTSLDFGEIGTQASMTSTRLVLNTGAVAGTVCGVFTGFYTGGG